MIRSITKLAVAAWLAFAAAAQADSPVVVELFTSQGCSACPPADKMLHDLAARDDVIALALHVDYWDYIGWTDEFAHPAHAERQRDYARAAGRRSIFTPQLIVNGTDSIVGPRGLQLANTITAHAAKTAPVDVTLTRSGGMLQIAATSSHRGDMVLHLLRYTPQRTTQIERGENAGHTITYANVTEDWTVLGTWNGDSALNRAVPLQGSKPVVVLVQQGASGPILGAARLR